MPPTQTIPPPPAGFQPLPADTDSGSIPPSPSGFVPADQDTGSSPASGGVMENIVGGMIDSAAKNVQTPTIGPTPKTTASDVVKNIVAFPNDPLGEIGNAANTIVDSISNYTQSGREAHPVLSRLGDAANAAREFLTGGQSAGKPKGTSSGALNNPTTQMVLAAPAAADITAAATERLGQAVEAMKAEHAAKAAQEASSSLLKNAVPLQL